MLKMTGALLVMLAATLGGWYQAGLYARRPRQIRELITALQRLMTEINYGFTPLPEAMSKMGHQQREPLRSLFHRAARLMEPGTGKSAQDSLHQAIEECWGATAMKQPEKEALRQLGFSLGTSDRQDQLKHVSLTIQQLSLEETAALADQQRYEKMWRSLGMLCGALVVILIF
ncbi:stage III sporulation protein SpoIIIAB [Paenibacillus sp. JX-17]|uniref:Stage III sporulation protein SpoIIIAB n=1 Tax=Paenibacillus lacisoli TaxID=3064525 RepID=A0ABT9C7D4_9BACL|nr:stage III sporulation protein SpoIIIAB [Paenibacillus sp. JX-17]MDO7905174.1 stage III sporulation protein SpoIIIAB [Paenibacillus sp. JX-17]